MANPSCSSCKVQMDPSNASPSVLRRGGYCRRCAADYMRQYKNGTCVVCAGTCSRGVMRCRSCVEAGKRRPRSPRRAPTAQLRIDPKTGRPAATKTWKAIRQSVIDSSDVCGICGEPVDKNTQGQPVTKHTVSVDHIVPLSLGGDPFDVRNLRLAHHGCNASAGATLTQSERDRSVILRLALHFAAAGL